MNTEEMSRLVEAWITAQSAVEDSPEHRENWWAVQTVIHLPYEHPDHTWTLILSVFEHSKFAAVRDILAAGPLEDLLTYHGPAYIEKVEAMALRDERFRSLLGGVWLDSEDTPVWRRVYEAAKVEPPFPEGWQSKDAV